MFKTILVAVDLDHAEQAREILGAAKRIAEAEGAAVYLLTVVPAASPIVSQYLHENYEQMVSGQAGKALAALARAAGLEAGDEFCLIRFGTVYVEILAAAAHLEADLIVAGSHKPNVADYLIGSNAARVTRHSTCSVLVIR